MRGGVRRAAVPRRCASPERSPVSALQLQHLLPVLDHRTRRRDAHAHHVTLLLLSHLAAASNKRRERAARGGGGGVEWPRRSSSSCEGGRRAADEVGRGALQRGVREAHCIGGDLDVWRGDRALFVLCRMCERWEATAWGFCSERLLVGDCSSSTVSPDRSSPDKNPRRGHSSAPVKAAHHKDLYMIDQSC